MCLPPPTSISPAAPIFPPPKLQQDQIPFPSIKTPNLLSPANGVNTGSPIPHLSTPPGPPVFTSPVRPAAVPFRTSPTTPQTVAFSSGSCLPASSPPHLKKMGQLSCSTRSSNNTAWSPSFSKLWSLCKSLLQDITLLRPMAVCKLAETEWKRRWIHSSKQGRSSKFARTFITCGWLRSNWKQETWFYSSFWFQNVCTYCSCHRWVFRWTTPPAFTELLACICWITSPDNENFNYIVWPHSISLWFFGGIYGICLVTNHQLRSPWKPWSTELTYTCPQCMACIIRSGTKNILITEAIQIEHSRSF